MVKSFYQNLVLKGGAAGNQILALLLIIYIYGVDRLGVYSILIATVQICAQVSGMGLNSYAQRKIPISSMCDNARLLLTQFMIVTFFSSLMSFILINLNYLIKIQLELIYIAVIMIYTNIFNAIFENTLNANKKPKSASLNVLIRGFWPIIVYGLYINDVTIDWKNLFHIIISFELMALVISFYNLKEYIPRDLKSIKFLSVTETKLAIRTGFIINSYSVIVLCIILTNRYVLGYWVGIEAVGIYFLFFQLVMFFPNLLEGVYYSIELPRMVQSNKTHKKNNFSINDKNYMFMIYAIFAGNFIIWHAYDLILSILNKNELLSNKYLLLFFFPISFLSFINRAYFYRAFVKGRDLLLFKLNSFIFVLLVIMSSIFTHLFGLHGAVLSMNLVIILSIFLFRKYTTEPEG